MEEPEPHQAAALPIPRGIAASVALAMIAVVLIGLWPGPFLDLSMRAAESLVAAGTPFR